MARKTEEKKGIGAARMSHADLARLVAARRETSEPAIMTQSIRLLPARPAPPEQPPIVTTKRYGYGDVSRASALRKRLEGGGDIDQRAALVELCDIIDGLIRER